MTPHPLAGAARSTGAVHLTRTWLLSLALLGGAACSGGASPDGGAGGGAAGLTGCAASTACSSGVCLASGSCSTCQDDVECAAGSRCGSTLCSTACTGAASCPTGWDCCGGRCTNPALDPGHCGACGTSCATAQLCGAGHCLAPTLGSLCQVGAPLVLPDAYAADNAASRSMAVALGTACGTSPVLDRVLSGSGVLDPLTGEPLLLGAVLVAGGGGFGQPVVGWLEAHASARVLGTQSGSDTQYRRADGSLVISMPMSSLGPSHDVFVVQVQRAPGGAVVLGAYGAFAVGTSAAAWYFAHTLAPQLPGLATAWVVVDWADTSRDLQPGAGDTFTVVASGS